MASEWTVRKAVSALEAGDRFVFDPEIGGEGEVVTFTSAQRIGSVWYVRTEELDFGLGIVDGRMVTVK